MKFLATTALLASNVAAFPYMIDKLVAPLADNARFQKYKREQAEERAVHGTGVGALPLVPPPFDAATQYVSNQGQYAFVAPTASDSRGECPGLNAIANHGYLPHNGHASI
ncbi:aromatic peroxygenase-like [Lecanosticta acicola]|uniref:Aromatic peroxygenase-like n=1 Tax=Lecanosticta acicola TaxID=111012 RepID=A0AAI8YYI5_9PEZI|nr:aromatic peroxygenase-like [Lecanosticta acicola]